MADPANPVIDAPDSGPLPELWCERSGSGPLVLLLHGFCESFRMWDKLAAATREVVVRLEDH